MGSCSPPCPVVGWAETGGSYRIPVHPQLALTTPRHTASLYAIRSHGDLLELENVIIVARGGGSHARARSARLDSKNCSEEQRSGGRRARVCDLPAATTIDLRHTSSRQALLLRKRRLRKWTGANVPQFVRARTGTLWCSFDQATIRRIVRCQASVPPGLQQGGGYRRRGPGRRAIFNGRTYEGRTEAWWMYSWRCSGGECRGW